LPIKDNKVFICCGLRCYKSVIKHIAGVKQSNTSNDGKSWLSWSNDGPQTGINSLQILLDWITMAGNYSRFTGGIGRETKLTVAGFEPKFHLQVLWLIALLNWILQRFMSWLTAINKLTTSKAKPVNQWRMCMLLVSILMF
jgi:hypothetical protein